jgi:putative colanic acid biosynthesis UDP-glucose lipid carrier transferase
MGLGKPFMIYKFRSMFDDAEAETRAGVPAGRIRAGRQSASCCAPPASTNSPALERAPGDMIVGPRPERPLFVAQFKSQSRSITSDQSPSPAGRGQRLARQRPSRSASSDLRITSNTGRWLDLKIVWLTLLRGFFHKHAYEAAALAPCLLSMKSES